MRTASFAAKIPNTFYLYSTNQTDYDLDKDIDYAHLYVLFI